MQNGKLGRAQRNSCPPRWPTSPGASLQVLHLQQLALVIRLRSQVGREESLYGRSGRSGATRVLASTGVGNEVNCQSGTECHLRLWNGVHRQFALLPRLWRDPSRFECCAQDRDSGSGGNRCPGCAARALKPRRGCIPAGCFLCFWSAGGWRILQRSHPARLASDPVVAHRVAAGRGGCVCRRMPAEEIAVGSPPQSHFHRVSFWHGQAPARRQRCFAAFAGSCDRGDATAPLPCPWGGHW
jgi:hypothetical protein